MVRVIFLFISVLSINLFGASYKGQDEFMKQCTKCHTNGQEFVHSKTMTEWKKLIQNNGEELRDVHITSMDDKAKSSVEYFNSQRYIKNTRHLRDFLIEYAKDSGRVPACN